MTNEPVNPPPENATPFGQASIYVRYEKLRDEAYVELARRGGGDAVSIELLALNQVLVDGLRPNQNDLSDLPEPLRVAALVLLADLNLHGVTFLDSSDPVAFGAAFQLALRYPAISIFGREDKVCLANRPTSLPAPSIGGAA